MIKIALIGQINVGKSTLFNRLITKPKAIVSKTPRTTRDRNYGLCQWQRENFTFIDTGGLDFEKKSQNEIEKQTKKQVVKAIAEADFIFFVIEVRPAPPAGGPTLDLSTGLPISNFEREISRLIKRTKKPCFLVLNKADNPNKREWAKSPAWLRLGFGQAFPISSVNGSGIGDLLDEVVNQIIGQSDNQIIEPQIDKSVANKSVAIRSQQTTIALRVAIVGKPNVGKSTLLNALLGEEKVIVSPLPHTTRGPQDTLIYHQKKPLLLIDTAGIRRQSKIKPGIEKIGVRKSLEVVQKSDIVLMVLDITQEISHQDKALINLIIKNKKGLILVINKCDLKKPYQLNLALAQWAPVIFISAKIGKNVKKIFNLIQKVKKNHLRWIEKQELNNFLQEIIAEKEFNEKIWTKVKIEQTNVQPPQFVLKVSKNIIRRKAIHQAQINIIEKELRKKWPFDGTPIKINLTT